MQMGLSQLAIPLLPVFLMLPSNNHNDYAVWRNALTDEEIARSSILPAMTQGTMIQPYYSGNMFYEGHLRDLIKLLPPVTAPGRL